VTTSRRVSWIAACQAGSARDTADSSAGVSASWQERREIRDDTYEAFLSLASAIIWWRHLRNLSPCQDLQEHPEPGGYLAGAYVKSLN
jgi:hypothetical protein